MKNKLRISVSVIVLTLSAAAAWAQGQPIVLDKLIGKVDNYHILKSDLDRTMAEYANQPKAPERCQLLQSLFINKLLLAKAEIDSVMVEDKQVDSDVNARMEQMILQFGSEKNIVEAYGKSIESLKNEYHDLVKEQLVARKMQGKITETVKITPNEVKKFFNAIPKDSIPYIPTEVEVLQIVRYAKATKEEKQKIKDRLVDFKRRVKDGEDFAKLAIENSEDPGSASNGGLYANVRRGQMVPEFEAAAMKLKPGEVSDLVETDYGIHLLQGIEIRGQEYSVRHILLSPDRNRLDLSEPTRFLDSLRTLIMADSLTFEKAAKEYSEDKNSADMNGFLANPATGANKLPLDETMDSYLYLTLDTMQVGRISKPLSFRTEDQKTAVRILYFKAKYPPHFANLKDDYQKLSAIALAQKRNKTIDEWFIKAKSEVFIWVDDEYKICDVLSSTRTGSQ